MYSDSKSILLLSIFHEQASCMSWKVVQNCHISSLIIIGVLLELCLETRIISLATQLKMVNMQIVKIYIQLEDFLS